MDTQTSRWLKPTVLTVLLLSVVLYMTATNENFLSYSNFMSAFGLAAPLGLVAIGMHFVILTAGIDLSVGSTFAFAAMVTALSSSNGMPAVVSLIIGIGAGALLGLFNGVLVSTLNLPAIVVTLATMAVYSGMALIVGKGSSIPVGEELAPLGRGSLAGIPVPVLVFCAVAALAYILLEKMPYGEYLYAYGTSPVAARYAGIRTRLLNVSVYIISGTLAGLGGVVFAAMVSSAKSNYGSGYEMSAVTMVVVGGTVLTGGAGGVLGTILAAVFIALLNNGLSISFIPTEVQRMLVGIALILTAVIYQWAPQVLSRRRDTQRSSNKTNER